MRHQGSAIIGISIVCAAVVFGVFFYQSRKIYSNKVRVVGSATRRIDSDTVKWNLVIGRNAGLTNLKETYGLMKNDLRAVTRYLQAKGIAKENVMIQPVNSNPAYGQNGITGYILDQRIMAFSNDIPAVEDSAINPKELYEQGVQIRSSNLEFFYSKLDEVRAELLKLATENAKSRAAVVADSAGDRIGKLLSANSGVFQIREPNSTEVSDYGIYNTASKAKDVSVTVTAVFEIK